MSQPITTSNIEERIRTARRLIDKACLEGRFQSAIEKITKQNRFETEQNRFGFSVSIAHLSHACPSLPTLIEVATIDFVAQKIDNHYLLQKISWPKSPPYNMPDYSIPSRMLERTDVGISNTREEAEQRLENMARDFEQEELKKYRDYYKSIKIITKHPPYKSS